MRGSWSIQVDRKALAPALVQVGACIVFVAVLGLAMSSATLGEFLWIAGAIIGVFLVIAAIHLLSAGIKLARITAPAASSEAPRTEPDCRRFLPAQQRRVEDFSRTDAPSG